MPRKVLLAIVLLVAGPLALLAWSAARTLRDGERLAVLGVRQTLESRLAELDDDLAQVMRSYARKLERASDRSGTAIEAAAGARDRLPFVRRVIVLDAKSIRRYPPPPRSDQSEEIAFDATLDGLISGLPAWPVDASTARGRWQVWFFDEGAQWIYWHRRVDGDQIGFWLERSRLLADLIEALPNRSPETKVSGTEVSGTWTQWVQPGGAVFYGWGDPAAATAPVLASVDLGAPLATWRLQTRGRIPIPSSRTPLLAAFASLAVLLLSVGVYLASTIGRQMRLAQARVDFASQVSHELRTPLTNIRLYAELAGRDLEHGNVSQEQTRTQLRQRLDTIQRESQRLGRLVDGVLDAVRTPRSKRTISRRSVIPDDLVREIVDSFAHDIQTNNLTIHSNWAAKLAVMLDPDVLGQCVANLMSNAIKYSRRGGQIIVDTRLNDDVLRVVICDSAQRLNRRQSRAVFRPFRRLDNSVTAPAGTGIGLTIARRLARLHGGDLRCLPPGQRHGVFPKQHGVSPEQQNMQLKSDAAEEDSGVSDGNLFELTISVQEHSG
ncbi:MAG: HAMP domain-containing sensor histidine kinase [Planctomycetota bacterium]